MGIDDLSASSESFVARVSASVATVDRCPGRGRALPAADNAFASVVAVPTEVGTGSAAAPAATTIVAQPTPFSRSFTQGTESVETTGPIVSVDNAFASVLAVPTEVGTGSAAAPAATTTVAQPTPFPRSSTQGTDSVETTGPVVSVPFSPGAPAPPTAKSSSDRISTRTRRRTATAAGNAPPAVDYDGWLWARRGPSTICQAW